MGLQDRLKSVGASQSDTNMLDRAEYTQHSYFENQTSNSITIDTLDSLINFASDYGVNSLIIVNGKINEITYVKNDADKDIKLSITQIIADLNQLKTDNQGYFRLQYGIDLFVEYYYEPLTPSTIIAIHNTKIDYYNLTMFTKLKTGLESGKNCILCGKVNFNSLSTILTNSFSSEKLICVNAPYVSSSSCVHFAPFPEQEKSVYSFISNRITEDFVIINEPSDFELFLSLWNRQTKILAFFPAFSAQEMLSVLENHLISDYSKISFVKRLDGIYTLSKTDTSISCRYSGVASPLTNQGKALLRQANILEYEKNKLYIV